MTLTDSRKTDIAFKKLINKDFTDTSKAWYEENDGGGFNVNLSTVWADSIPSTPPTSSNSVVEVWDDLVLTEDVSVAGERSWKAISGGAQLRYWIPPKYGQGYTVKIYEDSTKSNFLIGYKMTGLSFSDESRDFDANAFGTKPLTLTGTNLLITETEGNL